jgi:hypothetical protein
MSLHYKIVSGAIDGALFEFAVPQQHQEQIASCSPHTTSPKVIRGLIIHAHGCIPRGIPLQAKIDIQDELYKEWLAQGFIVAYTSYRREGLIIRDAMVDILNLRDYIEISYGRMNEFYIESGTCKVGMLT